MVHLVLLGWFVQDWDRIRMVIYYFQEIDHEDGVNDPPELLAAAYGYREDDPADLNDFRRIAEPLVSGISTPVARAQALADYIYRLRRPDLGDFDEDLRYGPRFLLARMQEGYHGNCGQMSTVLATFWRAMGSHTRGVRWATHVGDIGHYAVELWDDQLEKWFYYDININGFAHDDDGITPLSVAAVRSNLLTGEDYHVTSNARLRDMTPTDLREMVMSFPVESYVMNNDYLSWSRARRFGILNRYFDFISALPHPVDRVVDNVTGARDRRLIVRGRLSVGGLFSFAGARLFVGYLLLVIGVCAFTLRKTPSAPRADTPAPTAVDTHPSR